MVFRCFSLLLISLAPLFAAGGGKGNSGMTSPSPTADRLNRPLFSAELKATPKTIFQRVIQSRIYHLGSSTLEDASQTPVTVGRTLASLRPSFVTGIVRVTDHGVPGNAESEAYATIRTAVRSATKGCRFDVVVDAGQESSGALFIRRMKEIDNRIHPDAWTLYIAPDATAINPEAIAEAIAYAHSEGDMVGYDGPLSVIPEGVDYIVVRAWNLQVNREQIERLASRRVPLIVELPTTFGAKEHPDSARYMSDMDGPDRAALLTALALNQGVWGYRLAYPLYYPVSSSRKAFDATKDTVLMVTIRSLMARFN